MNKKTIQLSVIAGILFIISLIVHFNEHKLATTLAVGTEFISNFDVEKVTRISINEKGKEVLALKLEGESFVITNHNSFPASNKKVSDLLFKISNIIIGGEISDNEKKYEGYEVDSKSSGTHITLYDRFDKKLTEFFVGKKSTAKGNYIRRASKEMVYVSDDSINISTDVDSYIDKEIFNIDLKNVTSIKTSKNVIVAKVDDKFILQGPPAEEVDEIKVKRFITSLLNISFDKFIDGADQKVSSVQFENEYQIALLGKLEYLLYTAKHKDKCYLKVEAKFNPEKEELTLARDSGTEELKVAEQVLLNRDVSQKFNMHNKRWIYEIAKYTYEEILKVPTDFNKSSEQ
ncbi:MAG: DUF4340 domain-containing protein [Bacteriovoracaceae bacterium]|nr:DUF4340 domain-containing protein [Bacteriovoracaceae bacterium]